MADPNVSLNGLDLPGADKRSFNLSREDPEEQWGINSDDNLFGVDPDNQTTRYYIDDTTSKATWDKSKARKATAEAATVVPGAKKLYQVAVTLNSNGTWVLDGVPQDITAKNERKRKRSTRRSRSYRRRSRTYRR